MNKLAFKKELLEHCIHVLNQRANTAKKTMDELQQTANDYGQPRDRYDAFRNQLLRRRDMHAQQYQQAIDEIKILEKIETNELHPIVQFGSVVKTNKQNLFISVSLGKMEFQNQEFYAVSAKVPIYNALQGLKKGNQITFKNNTILIEDIY